MSFIAQHHADAVAFIKGDTSFALSGTSGKGLLAYTWAAYSGGGWTVKIGHAVVPDYVNEITADYDSGKITWTGTEKNGQITEVSYTKTG
jgi:hypothetical protein